MSAITSHQPLTIVLPHLALYTTIWSGLFVVYQRYVLPFVLSLAVNATSTSTGNDADSGGSGVSGRWSWWFDLSPSQQSLMFGRTLFAVHHCVVAVYGALALYYDSPALLYTCMYHEASCDIFDIVQIFHSKGFTGLNWQGILLHHLLSVFAILTSLTLALPVALLAKLAILLDGTGSADYLFSTVLVHTPAIEHQPVFALTLAGTGVFFVTRLLYFPVLGYQFVAMSFSHGYTAGVTCAVVIGLTCFFNVGMIRTRYCQYSKIYSALKTPGASASISMESRERQAAKLAELKQVEMDKIETDHHNALP